MKAESAGESRAELASLARSLPGSRPPALPPALRPSSAARRQPQGLVAAPARLLLLPLAAGEPACAQGP